MICTNSFRAKLSIFFSVFFLASCASLEQELYNQLQAIEDSIRGYRVQYETIPAGATILCNGEEQGVTPFFKYRDLSSEQKANQVLEINNCQALWPSGAQADIQVAIPLDKFPRFVHVATERPIDAPNYEIDQAFGAKTLAARQKLLNDIGAATAGFLALGVNLHEMSKLSSDVTGAVSAPSFGTPSRAAPNPGSIRWNWVQPTGVQMPSVTPASTRFTPVFPASSCTGTIVMGRCAGNITHTGVKPLCVGAVANGRCIGSVIFGE